MCRFVWTVALVLVVMDHCQDQKECRVLASAKTFAPDPCPGTSKYLQVAYQCRPNEFRSRVACENEELVLRCSRSERLAVYSAMFGRSQRGEHRNECPGQSAYDAECHEECALQTVMRACHGKRRCNLLATEQVFGNPCHEETSKYLSVVYTCVPRRILKANPDQFFAAFCNEGSTSVVPSLATEASTVVFSTTVNYSVTTYPGGIGDPSTTIEPEISASGEKINGFITDWIATWRFIAANQEKFILYTVMSLLIGLVLLLLVIIFVLVVQRHKAEKQAKLDISEPIANSTAAAESPALPPPETSLLLEDSSESNIEMLSFHQSNSLRRPPLSHAHHNSLDHNGQYPRGGSPFYNNTFRSDTAHRNYFYT
ncbi:hypothetical protein CAPTEDRAFT_226260 [Capitella teleta]|uniref:SUEL-type lectin domain-containing protein n=1 Tax=Capitella teleta TaxID=283909 RepID=R7TVC6_CAPTE|nr:hypothetical protein CAPTEDRAFT_226260 [Capitella teleta]|eukprot:ELT95416.1 hypothetical protein CAPTEDRAFT_226260 [Capitella teleta]